jgi:hypothetical protein
VSESHSKLNRKAKRDVMAGNSKDGHSNPYCGGCKATVLERWMCKAELVYREGGNALVQPLELRRHRTLRRGVVGSPLLMIAGIRFQAFASFRIPQSASQAPRPDSHKIPQTFHTQTQNGLSIRASRSVIGQQGGRTGNGKGVKGTRLVLLANV